MLTILFVGCHKEKPEIIATNSIKPTDTISIASDYAEFKNSVLKHKKELSPRPYKEISDYFFTLINNDIYLYWKGTPWDFYGTTRIPKSGTIACGYFVTTTLEDVGLKIKRRELAECRSGDMIKALCTDIHSFTKLEKLKAWLKSQPNNSVFIIGLDFHTGYIIKDSSDCYFMHSFYANNIGVVKEKVDESTILQYNNYVMIGSLTANEKLLRKWVEK
ncbi:hypothetical protein R1T16_09155 [Flavobacterium sp. DG1-102-2]|uniref:hypothetical protein n=1 Tax=Flavobacterium sp. DG1-102-2 TaxID=3081663 RepID=UPI002948C880|nr:hypothetical protein [Flavobacterium sp. DG1-102-2]MDV6168590.1 hypothetical protein [Flavobacterium sp. DG1-102-2]